MSPEHAIYLLIIVALAILGVAELWLCRNLYRRFQLPFLRTYFLNLVCMLTFGLFAYIGQNVVWRVIASLADEPGKFKLAVLFFPFLAFPFLVAAGYFFVRLFSELIGRRVPALFAAIYFGVQATGLVAFGVAMYRAAYGEADRLDAYARSAQVFFGAVNLAVLVVAVSVAVRGSRQIKLAARARSVRVFAGLHVALGVSRIALSLFVEDRPIIALPYVLLFFGGDLLPMFYLRGALAAFWSRRHEGSYDESWVSALARYDITRREAEVVALICRGKSNHEIADDLCISLQTVKSHVHNIFNKTKVKNRVQLTNLFR